MARYAGGMMPRCSLPSTVNPPPMSNAGHGSRTSVAHSHPAPKGERTMNAEMQYPKGSNPGSNYYSPAGESAAPGVSTTPIGRRGVKANPAVPRGVPNRNDFGGRVNAHAMGAKGSERGNTYTSFDGTRKSRGHSG